MVGGVGALGFEALGYRAHSVRMEGLGFRVQVKVEDSGLGCRVCLRAKVWV
jgi:hypothetical protein